MFEFDPAKSEADKAKHGIDFNEAMRLWEDGNRVEIPARTTDEPRFLVIGKIAGKHWSAVITHRGEKIRIVSVRRSRPEEVKLYEGQGE
ncbi:MAG: BrnT family toxin [Betaproteobacteria bacterium]|nr:BrnT family toxin [Betaproteobacteria bacterium]